MNNLTCADLLKDVLGELSYILRTGDMTDCNRDMLDVAAEKLGYASFAAFSEWCDNGCVS